MAAEQEPSVQAWLRTLGLPAEAAGRAEAVVARHSVDATLMDFLSGEEGTRLLQAWREERMALGASAGRGLAARSQRQQKEAPATPERAKMGRQRLSAADRQVGAHYFFSGPTASQGSTPPPVRKAEPKSRRAAKQPSATSAAVVKATRSRSEEETIANNPGRLCEGVLKNFNAEKGYGFIASADAEGDVFVHRRDLPPEEASHTEREGQQGPARPGRSLVFELVYTGRDEKPQARSVKWTADKRFSGYVKSLGDEYGFISCELAQRVWGRDVYVARSQLPTDEHTKLLFSIVVNGKGQPQATEIECEEEAELESEEDTLKVLQARHLDDGRRADEPAASRAEEATSSRGVQRW